MGKSGGRKKKGGSGNANQGSSGDVANANHSNATTTGTAATATANGGVDLDSSIFLKRAHELKEEGNKRFQNKDCVGALEQYDNALRLTPKTHPDRAVFHSNRAACLMQMKPIDYDTVIAECTMAIQAIADVEKATIEALDKQYADVLAPLKDNLTPKKFGLSYVKKFTKRSVCPYTVPDELGIMSCVLK